MLNAMMTEFVLGDGFLPQSLSPAPTTPRPLAAAAATAAAAPASSTRTGSHRLSKPAPGAPFSTYSIGDAETDPDTASPGRGKFMALSNVANATHDAALAALNQYDAFEAVGGLHALAVHCATAMSYRRH